MAAKENPKLKRMVQDLVAVADLVERNVDTAVMALVDGNSRLAYEVMSLDADIDEMEIIVDRQCLDLLGAEGGKGDGFRFLVAAMKINNDLERIGNQAVVIAEQVLALARIPGSGNGEHCLAEMLERAEVMVRESVEAFLRRDAELAWHIWEQHAGSEEELRRVMNGLVPVIEKGQAGAARVMHVARAAMALARVGENTKDIAEEVIYMREGIIVKHHEREFRRRKAAKAKS